MPFPDLAAIEEALQGRVAVTRFAPSPTGYLHLGHLVNALYVWGIAGALGGQVILRLEDHDRQRCRSEYESALLDDLEWLGLVPDLGALAEFRAGPSQFRQSDSTRAYMDALAQLQAQGLVYACDCSRKEVQARAPQEPGGELRYDGFCRDRGLAWDADCGLRLRLAEQEVAFFDHLEGPQVQVPAQQCGDVLLRDRHGQWTYQFAVVVDDIRHGVNLIVRGMDIMSSSGRQLQMAGLLGHSGATVRLHHGLLVDAQGRKLSKRDFTADIHSLHLAGADPAELLGEAAYRAGLIEAQRKIDVQDIKGLFLRKQ